MNWEITEQNIVGDKPRSSLPENVKRDFSLLTINKDKSVILGSYRYRVQPFPSDIDIHENFFECCTQEQVAEKFVTHVQEVVTKITSEPLHYFMELKAGLDSRYDFNPSDYNRVFDMYTAGMLNLDEYETLNDEIIDEEMKKEILRKHLVLRWDPSEIMSGYKTLPLGITMSLSKAVVEKSPVNIEIIVFLNGRFVEESNFFSLGQNLPDGKVKVLNGEQESYDNFNHFFIEELKKSIHKLLTSKLMFNPFKVIKRMFSLAKFTGDEASAAKLYPIIYSNISLLYQIKGDIKTLIKLLKSDNSFPMNYAMYELTNMKVRLSNVLQLSENFLEEFNNGIDNIVNNSNLPNEELIGRLEDLETPLEIIIDKEAVNFLKKNNLNV